MTRCRFLLFLLKDFNMNFVRRMRFRLLHISFKEYFVRRMRLRSLHIRCMACQTHRITFFNIVTILVVVQARQIGESNSSLETIVTLGINSSISGKSIRWITIKRIKRTLWRIAFMFMVNSILIIESTI